MRCEFYLLLQPWDTAELMEELKSKRDQTKQPCPTLHLPRKCTEEYGLSKPLFSHLEDGWA